MTRKHKILILFLILLVVVPNFIEAQQSVPKVTLGVQGSEDPKDFVLSMKIVALLTILGLAPSILIMMTSFTRIIVVFHFLRTALATRSTPPNQILIGLALFITFFVMKPVFSEINSEAIQPYINDNIEQKTALNRAKKPVKKFMLDQTRQKDLQLFVNLRGEGAPANPSELTLSTIIPSFVISELKTAFQIGFLLYMPMLMIDLIIASILLSMGMMMLPPMMISMPLKLLLFVLVDGWNLLVESLVQGFI